MWGDSGVGGGKCKMIVASEAHNNGVRLKFMGIETNLDQLYNRYRGWKCGMM